MYIQVFPYNTDFNTMEAWQPDGYFISNGPGDPEPLTEVQQTAKQLLLRKTHFWYLLRTPNYCACNGIPPIKCLTDIGELTIL